MSVNGKPSVYGSAPQTPAHGGDAPIDAETIMAKAGAALGRGDGRAAETLFREAAADAQDPKTAALALLRAAKLAHARGDDAAAVDTLIQAIRHDDRLADAHTALAAILETSGKLDAALHHALQASRLTPRNAARLFAVHHLYQKLGLWTDAERVWSLVQGLRAIGNAALPPFPALLADLTAQALKDNAVAWVAQRAGDARGPHRPPTSIRSSRMAGDPITIGYLSGDWRNHATAYLLVRCLELHDRNRFRVLGLDVGPQDDSAIGRRIRASVDHMVPLRQLTDLEALHLLHRLDLDLIVDLHGHTGYARYGILAGKAAAVQAAYLGFPGTTGAPWLDYAIVDPIVAPTGAETLFTEQLIRIPCYQPNDDRPAIGPSTDRSAHGLPRAGVVFGAMNHVYKVTAPVLELWLRCLDSVPGSVLWMYAPPHPLAMAELRGKAQTHGIDPDRLVFAPKIDHAAHLERLRHADVMLDTRPYTGHTTTSDALWMGVPVVTWPTDAFHGRVAASLLCAVGLPELVADSAETYVRSAIELALNDAKRHTLRDHLLTAGRASRLFDAATHVRELEAAYAHMVERARRGAPPQGVDLC